MNCTHDTFKFVLGSMAVGLIIGCIIIALFVMAGFTLYYALNATGVIFLGAGVGLSIYGMLLL